MWGREQSEAALLWSHNDGDASEAQCVLTGGHVFADGDGFRPVAVVDGFSDQRASAVSIICLLIPSGNAARSASI